MVTLDLVLKPRKILLLLIAIMAFSVGCSSEDSSGLEAPKAVANIPLENDGFKNYLELGDLPALKKRKIIRVLLSDTSIDIPYFPRQGLPIHYESDLLSKFAEPQGR
jgi:hypothetical protein